MSEAFVQTTNYMPPEMFHIFKESLIRTHPFHFGKPPMNADRFVMLYQTLYDCGLRVSEGLRLQKRDFNLKNRILTIRESKTGKHLCQICSSYKKGEFKKTIIVKKENCTRCNNTRFVMKDQFTTIIPPTIQAYEKLLAPLEADDVVFPCSRMTTWQYAKNAGIMAGLPIFEQQEYRTVTGVWTHLFRKSCAKRMRAMGASVELVAVKLRHHNYVGQRAATFQYTKPDINALLDWEAKVFA